MSARGKIYALEYEGVEHRNLRRITDTQAFGKCSQRTNHVSRFAVHERNNNCEGNRAAIGWVANGTHLGRVMNIPPTGRQVQRTRRIVIDD